jgi:hypothetical protein
MRIYKKGDGDGNIKSFFLLSSIFGFLLSLSFILPKQNLADGRIVVVVI